MLSAIIVAAGSSQRMGFDKLLALLGDRPVLAHTIDAFERTPSIDEIILVARAERVGEFEELVRQQGFKKVRSIIPGRELPRDSRFHPPAPVQREPNRDAVLHQG